MVALATPLGKLVVLPISFFLSSLPLFDVFDCIDFVSVYVSRKTVKVEALAANGVHRPPEPPP